MSIYQGQCGDAWAAPVLPDYNSQLSASSASSIRAAAVIRGTGNKGPFASGKDYILNKKARTLEGASTYQNFRAPVSASAAALLLNPCPLT
jgi:hypothetical protein